MKSIQNNFKDAPWFQRSEGENISVLGAGGIGSNTLYNLAKTLKSTFYLFDFDTVEEHNIGSQFFRASDRGSLKIAALKNNILSYIPSADIKMFNENITKYKSGSFYILPIVIAGFDNMEARKHSFEDWVKNKDRELFIDGRLRATQYEVFTVKKGQEDRYRETLFDDKEVLDEECTFKQTTYAGMMIGARITSILVNYLANKYSEEPVYSVPFHYQELLELCYTKITE